ncbi:MAG: hypothetical protein HOO67_00945, partial [Candidatus Peribacteraceae bacterium]|nr:hypothetical protein [Candidatus Peribacteraceae bacterium]
MRSFVLVLCIGGAITLAQLLFVSATQPARFTMDSYTRLFQWDSVHYADLMTTGYRNTLPPLIGDTDPSRSNFLRNTNVAFFPGYVIAGNIVRAVTGFTPRISLLLAAALAAWGFWSPLLLFLQRWKFSPISQSIVIL